MNTTRISTAQETCRAAGPISGCTEECQRENKKQVPTALYQFDIDVNLPETLGHDKVLSSLISVFCISKTSANGTISI